ILYLGTGKFVRSDYRNGFFGGLDGNDDSDAPMGLKIEAIIPILRLPSHSNRRWGMHSRCCTEM
uniref:Uncharacterized protein n=1 Tax=Megaselia scalaris TaxID=36166 RepID=T1GG64_MEGSC